jgi:TatD DNase family protein
MSTSGASEREALVDFDANLLHDALKADAEGHISRAQEHANVKWFCVPGSTLGDSTEALNYSKSRDGGSSIIATAGVHPYHVIDETDLCTDENKELLRTLCSHELCRAVGETGLDYSEGFPDREMQLPWFRAQVALALEMELPLFLHVREAREDFVSIMTQEFGFSDTHTEQEAAAAAAAAGVVPLTPVRACVHCFTGSTEELRQYVRMGFYIGLTGYVLTMNKGDGDGDVDRLREWLEIIPSDRLVIETDAPYLGWPGCRATETKKKKSKYPNVPASLSVICEAVAQASGRSYEEVAASTTRNALTFFDVAQ